MRSVNRIPARVRRRLARRSVKLGCAILLLSAFGTLTIARATEQPPIERIVSLNPSLTAILLALDARELLVGVDDYSARLEERVAGLPKVGGLFNPSLEAVVALAPDVVLLVPGVEQRDLRNRLEALGVPVIEFQNHRFEEVLENIERLGALTGRRAAAERRIDAIERTRSAVARAVARLRGTDATPPRGVMVLQRDPLFVVGAGNFMDSMLLAVGIENLAREFTDAYPRVAMEWLVAARPEIIIDLSSGAEASSTAYWKHWPGLPAVEKERVVHLGPKAISMPGPGLDRAIEALAIAVWGEQLAALIDTERSAVERES